MRKRIEKKKQFDLFKIIDFDRKNLFTHFCFSELLILRQKGSRTFLEPLKCQKNYKFSKNSEKRYNFAQGAANNTFFTQAVCMLYIAFKVCI